jgi:aryl-alcohol dehydrogenase-like predicted oxidoreductase
MAAEATLGCGLIAIGREWGTTPAIPSEADAQQFLDAAYELGVRVFDTAPSYGMSEARLGTFLARLTPEERQDVTVATKFGEHWNTETNSAYADHSLEALKRSLDQSANLLGSISILQLHKTSPEVLASDDVREAFTYARSLGIPVLGASISDPVSAELVVRDDRFMSIQLPYNEASLPFQEALRDAADADMFVLVNRPFQMGKVSAGEAGDKHAAAVRAYGFILQESFKGAVLTGTANIDHLRENMAAFAEAAQ